MAVGQRLHLGSHTVIFQRVVAETEVIDRERTGAVRELEIEVARIVTVVAAQRPGNVAVFGVIAEDVAVLPGRPLRAIDVE